jgi:hypothetical protein
MMSLAHIPGLGHAPWALAEWMLAAGYNAHYREGAMQHAARHGTLAGLIEAGLLDATDEDRATEVFVSALPGVPQTATTWDEDGSTWAIGPEPDEDDPEPSHRQVSPTERAMLAAFGCI